MIQLCRALHRSGRKHLGHWVHFALRSARWGRKDFGEERLGKKEAWDGVKASVLTAL